MVNISVDPTEWGGGGLYTIDSYKPNPELKYFNVSLDNGLKIYYRGYAITYRPLFVLNDGTVKSWSDITNDYPNIQKDLWKTQVKANKYKHGVSQGYIFTSFFYQYIKTLLIYSLRRTDGKDSQIRRFYFTI